MYHSLMEEELIEKYSHINLEELRYNNRLKDVDLTISHKFLDENKTLIIDAINNSPEPRSKKNVINTFDVIFNKIPRFRNNTIIWFNAYQSPIWYLMWDFEYKRWSMHSTGRH